MGTWGANVTASDTAQDLQDEYSAAFSYYDVPTALEKIDQYVRTMFDESDEIEWCNYYYSLANYMWKKGILTDEVRSKAVEMVESDYGIQEWIDAGKAALKDRRKELDKFVKKITSPQCEPKKIKVSIRPNDVFTDGEVIAIELKTDDKKYIKKNHKSPEISDEEFLAYNKKIVVIQKVYSVINCRSVVVPEVYDRVTYFRVFEGVYDSIEDVDINTLKVVPVMDDGLFISLSFQLDNSMTKFRKRNCKVLGTKEFPKINGFELTRYFDLNSNYKSSNFDSEILDILVDKKFAISECSENPDYDKIKKLISLDADREVFIARGLTHEEYRELCQKRKLYVEEKFSELEKKFSNGAKVYELKFGKTMLGMAIKTLGEPAVIYMRSDDDGHRRMLQEFVDNV